jgi:hypothetical protein
MADKLLIGYKLVKPYPYQKVGDIVKFNSLKEWRFERTNLKIEKRLLETDFFEPFYFDKKVGDEVIFKDYNDWRHGAITKVSGETITLKMLDGKKPKTTSIHYSKVTDKITYYHFNSLLQPCLAAATSFKKINEMEERVLSGNYFDTKEDCKEFIEKLKELLKQKRNVSKNIQEAV